MKALSVGCDGITEPAEDEDDARPTLIMQTDANCQYFFSNMNILSQIDKDTGPSSSLTSSNDELNYEEFQYLSLLLDLIESKKWFTFGYAIASNPKVFQTLSRSVMHSSQLNKMTILHACIRFNPPPQIVKVLLDLNPESSRCVDCLQRTPLHVAAGTRARLSVIKMLARSYPQACAIQDEDGKTPLHLACDSACELFEDDGPCREPPSYEVVCTLLSVCPSSAPLEDRYDMSALEHAIVSEAHIDVVKMLQYVTRKQCERAQKKRKKVEELPGTPLRMNVLARRVSQDSLDHVPSKMNI